MQRDTAHVGVLPVGVQPILPLLKSRQWLEQFKQPLIVVDWLTAAHPAPANSPVLVLMLDQDDHVAPRGQVSHFSFA